MSVILFLHFQVSQSSGDLVVGWDFSNVSSWAASPHSPSQVSPNLSSSIGLSRGSGVTTSGSSVNNTWGGNGFTTAGLANSLAAGDFVSFSFTVGPSSNLSLEEIAPYNIRRSIAGPTTVAGPTTGQWQYQLGTGSWTNIGGEIIWGNTGTSSGNLQSAIDLTLIGDLQNLSSGTTVSIRVANWGASVPDGYWLFNNYFVTGSEIFPNDLQINGTFVAVPEPSAFLFGSLISVVLGTGYIRRRLKEQHCRKQ